MCFHSYQIKEKVICEARKRRGELRYEVKQMFFYENYPADVMELHAEYKEVMAQLYKLGLRPTLLYPAWLMITMENGEKVQLSSIEEAKKYIATKDN